MSYIGGVNVLSLGAGVIRQKVFAVFLGPAGFGLYSLAQSFFELLHTLTRMGAHTGLLREMSRSARNQDMGKALAGYRVVRFVVLGGAVVVAASVALGAEAIAQGPLGGELPGWMVRVVGLAVPFFVGSALADAGLNALDRIRRLALAKAVTTVGSLAVMVVLVWRFGLTGAVLQIALGAVIGFLASQVLFGWSTAGTPATEAEDGLLGRVFGIGVAQTVYFGALTANLFVFRAIIVGDLGAADNGIYQGVMGVSRQYVGALVGGVFVYLYPRLSRLTEEPEAFRQELTRSLRAVLAVAVPLSLLLLGSRDWIVGVIFTEEFGGMVPLMALSLSGDVAVVAVHLLLSALLAAGWTWRYALFGFLGEALHLGVFLWLLPFAGLEGAVLAYLVYGIVMALALATYLSVGRRLAVDRRLSLQVLAALVLLAVVAAVPAGTWVARAAGLSLAVGWAWLWRVDLRVGLGS